MSVDWTQPCSHRPLKRGWTGPYSECTNSVLATFSNFKYINNYFEMTKAAILSDSQLFRSCQLECMLFIMQWICMLLRKLNQQFINSRYFLYYAISEPIKFLTSILKKAIGTSTHRYLGLSASELAEGLTQIAVNDNNKKTVKCSSVVWSNLLMVRLIGAWYTDYSTWTTESKIHVCLLDLVESLLFLG